MNKINKLTCFECGDTDHIIKDCPQRRKSFNNKRDNGKKAMVATWSDSDSSDDSDCEQTNLCLATNHEDSKENHLEVMVKNLVSLPTEVLSEVIRNMIVNEENLILESNSLKEKLSKQDNMMKTMSHELNSLKELNSDYDSKIKDLEEENSVLKQKFVSLSYQNNDLEKDNRKLIIKCKDQYNSLVKFTKSETTLNKMLGENQSSLNKHGLGHNRKFPKTNVTTFVKAKKYWHTPTCFYCCKKVTLK